MIHWVILLPVLGLVAMTVWSSWRKPSSAMPEPEPVVIVPPLPVRGDFLAPGIQAIHDRYEAMAHEQESATGGPKLAGQLKYAEMLKLHGA